MKSLDELGIRCGTDKTSLGHDFLNFYEELFGHMRTTPCSIIEFGVRRGGSILLWQEAFPHATVVGVDLDLASIYPQNRRAIRATLVQADLKKREEVAKLCKKHGPFDVAIDDSAHTSDVTRNIVEVMLPDWIKPGGWLVIEDVNSGYKANLKPEQIHDQVEYCMSLVKTVQFHGRLTRSGPNYWPKDASPLEKAMKQIIYRPGVMAIQRR